MSSARLPRPGSPVSPAAQAYSEKYLSDMHVHIRIQMYEWFPACAKVVSYIFKHNYTLSRDHTTPNHSTPDKTLTAPVAVLGAV